MVLFPIKIRVVFLIKFTIKFRIRVGIRVRPLGLGSGNVNDKINPKPNFMLNLWIVINLVKCSV